MKLSRMNNHLWGNIQLLIWATILTVVDNTITGNELILISFNINEYLQDIIIRTVAMVYCTYTKTPRRFSFTCH